MKPDPFRDYILDQLHAVKGLDSRAMFGGHGFYSNGVFFAILWKETLYFLTSDASRPRYVKAGMKPFRPRKGKGLTSYYEVPGDVIENARELATWAAEAVKSRGKS